jgi:NarL family two-component system sensor histidine kinase LiaS
MIAKTSRSMLALYSGIATFLILVFVLFTYLFATGQKNWWLQLFQVKVLFIPMIFYLLAIAIVSGISIFVLLSFTQKRLLAPIEEKMRLLANGNLESKTLNENMPLSASNKELFNMDNDIHQIKEKLKEMSSELQILNARPQVVDGQTKEEILENERHRLARELHDSVSQQLFAAMMMMSALNEQAIKTDAPEAQRKQLAMVSDIINASQSEMRALLLHLRPVTLEGKSLKQGIEQLLRELQTKIKISLKWDIEDLVIPSSIEDQLFRVVQELLSNTLRHAKAEELEVYLNLIDQNILLRVIDDGVGFDPEKQQKKAGSYGLMNIRERITGIGGTLEIISFKNQGTSIEIKIPLLKEVISK